MATLFIEIFGLTSYPHLLVLHAYRVQTNNHIINSENRYMFFNMFFVNYVSTPHTRGNGNFKNMPLYLLFTVHLIYAAIQ